MIFHIKIKKYNRSKCGNGPNICVFNRKTNEEQFFSGISDATSASAVLDLVTSAEGAYPIELLVAADVISKVGNSKYRSFL